MRRFLLNSALIGAIAVVSGILARPPAAQAWSGESTIREGCHEMLTFSALDAAQWPDGATPPAPTAEDTRLLNDLPFDMPARHRNIWAATVVLANREVDLGGHEPDDFPELSHYHAEPDLQALHCLRAPEHDGPQGDDQALAACRATILAEIDRALGPGDSPDLAARETQPVYLVFRHSIDVSLPRFHYHLGRALHALQDGFSHAFRDPNQLEQVRHVLNYTDHVSSSTYSAERDGHEHLSYLDACVDVDDLQERRALMAAEASAALMDAIADGTGGRAGRMARAEEVLVRYLSKDPDIGEMECTAANDWCSAPEPALSAAYESRQSGCSVAAAGGGSGGIAGLLLAIAAALGFGRRARRRARRRLVPVAVAAVAALGLLAGTPVASADETEDAREQAMQESVSAREHAMEEHAEAMGAPEGDFAGGHWGLYLMGRGSLQDAALAGGLGVRWDFAESFTLGLDVEYNPWLNVISGGQFSSPGTVNAYLTGIGRWDVEDYLEVRTTVHVGAAYLLDDLVGAPSGSIGPFLGIAPVGVAFRFGGHYRFVVDPGVMIPIPQMTGVPMARVQYGVAIGLQWNP